MLITSLENEKIKNYLKLKEKKYRDSLNKFMVEGEHLVIEAYRSNLLEEILIEQNEVTMLNAPITYVTKEILAKLSNLETPSHIIGICKKKEESNNLGNKLLLLDKVQDPGNLGTIIRSSKAFNIDTVVLGSGCVDLYNDKVIRSTQGIGFSMNIISRNLEELIYELKKEEIPVLGTRVVSGEDIRNLTTKDKEKYALIMGNEGRGVDSKILDLCDKFIYIKMNEDVESLNVAIASSILLYELSR
jgi:TrmH family RNA methyltransferase